jgi:DNA topoisomerase-1
MVAVIRKRDYVRRQGKVLIPTELGFAVCDLLVDAFSDLFDYQFTAHMEDQLDDIANGRAKRLGTLRRFWGDLSAALESAESGMPSVKLEPEAPQPTGRKCPQCGSDLVRRRGSKGAFVGCSNYPACKYTERSKKHRVRTTGLQCPRCGADLVERKGKYGPFLGCSSYPTCKYTAPLRPKAEQAGGTAPPPRERDP